MFYHSDDKDQELKSQEKTEQVRMQRIKKGAEDQVSRGETRM